MLVVTQISYLFCTDIFFICIVKPVLFSSIMKIKMITKCGILNKEKILFYKLSLSKYFRLSKANYNNSTNVTILHILKQQIQRLTIHSLFLDTCTPCDYLTKERYKGLQSTPSSCNMCTPCDYLTHTKETDTKAHNILPLPEIHAPHVTILHILKRQIQRLTIHSLFLRYMHPM